MVWEVAIATACALCGVAAQGWHDVWWPVAVAVAASWVLAGYVAAWREDEPIPARAESAPPAAGPGRVPRHGRRGPAVRSA